MKREITCIVCPRGCRMTADIQGEIITVTGHSCPKGERYAIDECTAPTRTLTSTVRLADSEEMLPVKTASPIPKEALMPAMAALRGVVAHAPVAIGDVVVKNVAATGVDIIATKNVK